MNALSKKTNCNERTVRLLLLCIMYCRRAFPLYLKYQGFSIQKCNTYPKTDKHENTFFSKPFAFYWPWSFGTFHHKWNNFEDVGSQMNFCCGVMPAHARINCAKEGETNDALMSNEVTSESILKGMSILLSARSLIKKVSATGMTVPYQAGNKRNLLSVTSKSASSHLLLFLGITAFLH